MLYVKYSMRGGVESLSHELLEKLPIPVIMNDDSKLFKGRGLWLQVSCKSFAFPTVYSLRRPRENDLQLLHIS